MDNITVPVFNAEGKEIETIKLDSSVFDGVVNSAAIHQVIINYTANQRRGLAATKTRGEVSGGGKKPWKQKGTGRARVGSTRSPLWRHGGVVFGPHPRDFSYTIPAKIKNLALKSALCAKLKENNFIVVDNFKTETLKTKEAARVLSNLKIDSAKTLLLMDKVDAKLMLVLRNIDFLDFSHAKDTNTYEVMSARKLIITKSALKELTDRLKS